MMESTRDDVDAMALRRWRRVLEDRVEGVSALLASRPDMPTADDFDGLEQGTAATLEALAALLDAIDGALAGAGSGDELPRLSVASARYALGLEGAAASAPVWQRCLAELYGRVCARNDTLRVAVTVDATTTFDPSRLLPPEPGTDWARWAALVDCWTRVAYLGSTHAAGGLAARLATHPLDLVSLTRTPRGGRRLWERVDLDALRALASGIHQQNSHRRAGDGDQSRSSAGDPALQRLQRR